MINPIMWLRIVVVAIVVALLGYLGWQCYLVGRTEVRMEWDKAKLKDSAVLIETQDKLRTAEAQLAAQAAATRKTTNDEVQALTAQRDDLVRRLRIANSALTRFVSDRTAVAASGPVAGPSGATAVPATPGEPDVGVATLGEQDVDEALRADIIRLNLLACYAQYDRAAEALNSLISTTE